MDITDWAHARLTNALNEIRRIRSTDFPFADARELLLLIENELEERRSTLSGMGDHTPDHAIAAAISTYNKDLHRFLRWIGFVLRSTNIRNAFEYHFPLQHLLRQLIGSGGHLILSTEWSFVPFTDPQVTEVFPDFVMIGLPASEAGNSLIIPAAGHEMGHAIWIRDSISKRYNERASSLISSTMDERRSEADKIFQRPADKLSDLEWFAEKATPTRWCRKIVEELFCDFVGLGIFGRSYLYTFAYLTAPRFSETRTVTYPDMQYRARVLEDACDVFGIRGPANFTNAFALQEAPFPRGTKENFILKVVDDVVSRLIPDLRKDAKAVCADKVRAAPSEEAANMVKEAFQKLFPWGAVGSMGDILNAAWDIQESNLTLGGIEDRLRKTDVLNQLVLKSIELYEIEIITGSE